MKAKDKVKQIFAPKKKEGGVVIMIGKPSKMKGKEMEDDDDKCEECGKKGCKMKCGGKVKKYQDGGKVTGDSPEIKKYKEQKKKEAEWIKLEKSTSGKKFQNMSNEEKAFTMEKRQADEYHRRMYGSKPTKKELEERKNVEKMAEVRYKLADMYRKAAESKKAKGGKVFKMKKGGKC